MIPHDWSPWHHGRRRTTRGVSMGRSPVDKPPLHCAA